MPPVEVEPADFGRRFDYAAAFTAGLLDPDRPPPDLVLGPKGKAATKRYAVYRNNVTVSLIDALAASFPATQRITGKDFFRAMARFHVRATPPDSPLLFEYGRDFPDFIERYEYAQPMPWLADVARIERAWLDAYHAARCGTAGFRGTGVDIARKARGNGTRAASGNADRAFALPGRHHIRSEPERRRCRPN